MTGEELNKILENHMHWLNEDIEGWEDMKANFSGADLSGAYLCGFNFKGIDLTDADLSNADLRHANLKYANLSGVDLSNADLSFSYLTGANLIRANLTNSDLRHANLSGANLTGVDLTGANLSCVCLSGANLTDANLIRANLSCANLSCANLSDVSLRHVKGAFIEFRKGKMLTEDIIGYKKCEDDVIVKLLIPRGAIVFSINGKKCRTNKAKVLEIEGATRAISQHKYMSYYVGDEFTVYDFNCEYNVECASGIHFFMTREDAVDY